MTAQVDLVVRGATVVDGTGGEPRQADVAIADGRIAEVGAVSATGVEEIDARGKLVTPGFVDIHTHYDGQASWDGRLWPSSLHGVTTAVMGNCGVGFAPCRSEDHDRLIELMEGVEDIPHAVLAEGLSWDWESFPQFLDTLDARPHDIDFATQVPHAALRVYVMGERGAQRQPATPQDIEAMARLAREGVAAGALGFSTSRTINHRTATGDPTPTLTAGEDELLGIAMGLRQQGAGVLQVIVDFRDPLEDVAMLRRIVERSGRPLSVSLTQHDAKPQQYREVLSAIAEANAAGQCIRAQVCGRPVSIVLGLEATFNPFRAHAVYKEIWQLPLAERCARLREPELRARLLAEDVSARGGFVGSVLQHYDKMFPLTDPPDYEPTADKSVAAQAVARGISPAEHALDLMLQDEGKGMLYVPFLNYAQGDLDASLEMLRDEHTIPGLGDGGAHLGMICDGSFPTYMLTHWTRDRTRGQRLPLPFVIKRQCADTAAALGLHDRGLLRPGYRADLNVIDYDRLHLHAPRVIHDLPAGGRRLMQRADGYEATIVAGQLVYRDGQHTGVLPGKLVRGGQPAPGQTLSS